MRCLVIVALVAQAGALVRAAPPPSKPDAAKRATSDPGASEPGASEPGAAEPSASPAAAPGPAAAPEPAAQMPPLSEPGAPERAGAEPPPAMPAGQRLSPRNDVIAVSFSATHRDELSTQDLRLRGAAPLVRGDGYGGALLLGYGATHIQAGLDEADQRLALHRFEATLGGGMALAPGWSLRGSLGAAYASDLRIATWSALQVTSSAMVHHVLGTADALLVGLVYTSTADLYPVLPIVGYVHQRDGSPLRFDVFLPHHARAEYELGPRLHSALGIEVVGNTWIVEMARTELRARRAGGAVFGELQIAATGLLRLEARAGVSVDRYTLPAMAGGATLDQPLRAAAFAQLAVLLVP